MSPDAPRDLERAHEPEQMGHAAAEGTGDKRADPRIPRRGELDAMVERLRAGGSDEQAPGWDYLDGRGELADERAQAEHGMDRSWLDEIDAHESALDRRYRAYLAGLTPDELSDDRLSDDRLSDDRLSDDRLSDDRLCDDQPDHPPREHAAGHHPAGNDAAGGHAFGDHAAGNDAAGDEAVGDEVVEYLDDPRRQPSDPAQAAEWARYDTMTAELNRHARRERERAALAERIDRLHRARTTASGATEGATEERAAQLDRWHRDNAADATGHGDRDSDTADEDTAEEDTADGDGVGGWG